MNKLGFILLVACMFSYSIVYGQLSDSTKIKLFSYPQIINNFTKNVPQEKVYLHFDNNCYYQGDDIWFKCYLVTNENLQLSDLSKTLYIELLSPEGDVVEKKILKLENGHCSGNFTFNNLMFHAGLYEVRAYTKYMLNWGDDLIFSRVFPVFDKPEKEGDYQQLMKKTRKKYIEKRERPKKGKKVNVKFYPEGGNLINGLESRIAFEATDETGSGISVKGIISDENKNIIGDFFTQYGGRGYFTYTPKSEGKVEAKVYYNNKEYKFKLPEPSEEGFILNVDPISDNENIIVKIKRKSTPFSTVGIASFCRGKIYDVVVNKIEDDKEYIMEIPKWKLPNGVSQIILFNEDGNVLTDRLVFNTRYGNNYLKISHTQNKKIYNPYEKVEMDFEIKDASGNPVQTSFSLSVKDNVDGFAYSDNIVSNLLLSSELRGYIENPEYYFESDDIQHRQALDLLLMVQGWRRYDWQELIDLSKFDLKYLPEENILIKGHVRSLVKKVPKADVDITYLLKPIEADSLAQVNAGMLKTSPKGNFWLSTDLYGKWSLTLQTTEKDKKKDYDILLDRLFSPEPKRYLIEETVFRKNDNFNTLDEDEIRDSLITFFDSIPLDSLRIGLTMDQKIYHLKEVTITEKKSSDVKEREENIKNSIAFYDVREELDIMADKGDYVGDDLDEFIRYHHPRYTKFGMWGYRYQGRYVLFVINNRLRSPQYYRMADIKSIYVSEESSSIVKYAPPKMSPLDALSAFSAVIFIDTYNDEESRPNNAKGLRKTVLEGYSRVKEFYSPDYDIEPVQPDYRRTLYWNPDVETNENGVAKIHFFNNSTCRKMEVSAETITSNGKLGVYKAE